MDEGFQTRENHARNNVRGSPIAWLNEGVINIMLNKKKISAVGAATVLGISLALPALGQDTSSESGTSASSSMHQAGEDSESAAKNAYKGTVTAIDDTGITTVVKTNLAAAKDLRSGQIHVATTAGVVTLEGAVHDSEIVSRAEAIAKAVDGVRSVNNELRVSSSVPKD